MVSITRTITIVDVLVVRIKHNLKIILKNSEKNYLYTIGNASVCNKPTFENITERSVMILLFT